MLDASSNAKSGAIYIGERLFSLFVLPIWLWFLLESIVLGRTRSCTSVSQYASKWIGTMGVYLRRAILKRVLARMGKEVYVAYGTIFTKHTTELGDCVYIGSCCIFGDVRIGDGTQIADLVAIPSGAAQHGISRLDIPIKDQPGLYSTVHIGADTWIGSSSVILADVGNHCVVGAGSVVTKPVDDYMIVAGNPARPIGDRRNIRIEKK